MRTDIVDLTDEFNEIIAKYEGGFSNDGWVVDFDAWDMEDLCRLADILDKAVDHQFGAVHYYVTEANEEELDEECIDEYLSS